MKKIMISAMMVLALTLQGCHNTKVLGNVEYDTYGFVNKDEKMNPSINYEVSMGSVIAAVILCETIIVPLYIICYDLYQPVSIKTGKEAKGQVNQ